MDHGEMSGLIYFQQRLQGRMEPEKTVQIQRRLLLTGGRIRNGNGRPQLIVSLLPERNDDIQTIGRAALEDSDENLPSLAGFPGCNPLQEQRRTAEAYQCQAAGLHKNAPG